jgi:altered-inheritance-of-mitochondria protein 13
VEVGALDKDVEKARDEVVRCLRGNDRRPLDCWREAERFREEVRRVEEAWVEKVVR